MPNLLRLLLAVVTGTCAVAADSTPAETRLLRFPAIHGDQVVFGYAGDLYTVPSSGGVARRLTSDPEGYEMFPRFSPDGRHVAFTGQYDGNTEVYVMPAQGGEPRRLTYTATLERDDVSDRMGPNNIVLTWRDNETIVYRSRRTQWNPFKGELTLARLSGGIPEVLPLPRGGWCGFSPDGKQLAYNRIFREFRTWKRYRGGQADEIWLYDFATKETTRLTENPAQDMFPMWKGDRIYFVSERDDLRQANLYVLDLKTKETRQLTRFTEFAVKFPSLGDSAIIFENGGYLHRFDLATEQTTRIPIEIREDLASGRGGWRDVAKEIASAFPAPDGSRAVLVARGDVFTVPAKNGPTRNLSATPGVHERDAAWSPDGKWIAFISDASGEDELWILQAQDGRSPAVQLTTDADTYYFAPQWSPDSTKLLWSDRAQRLRFIDITTKAITTVDENPDAPFGQFEWAPDSQWITWTRNERGILTKVMLYSLADKTTQAVTDGWYDATAPAFSDDGKWLMFASARDYQPIYSDTEWNHAYQNMERIYLVALAKDTPSPFAPKSDEVAIAKDEPKPAEPAAAEKPEPTAEAAAKPDAPAGEKPKGEKAKAKVVVKVDADGLSDRIIGLPVTPSNYSNLRLVGGQTLLLPPPCRRRGWRRRR
jgi:tricorn protease